VGSTTDTTRFARVFINSTTGLALNKDALTGRVVVKRCLPDSPAMKLGIEPGTFLVSVGGVRIPDKHHQEIKTIIRRAARPVTIEFSTVWPPRSEQTFFSRVFTESTIGLALNMDSSSRTIVTRCLPNTPAFRRDIPAGVYVVAVNEEYVVGKHFKEVQRMCRDAERPLKIDFSTIPPAKKGERPPKPAAEAVYELGIVAEAEREP
jgi:C-terminal processing protease CtpA/Prc